ncbi:MAG: sugar phosphate isomerase/epimerase family protein [Kiritimatiellia bacterium]
MTTRRDFLAATGAAGAMAAGAAACPARAGRPAPWRYAMNPPTIGGYKCPLKEQVRLSIAAGYDGIEPWLADIQKAKAAGELADIRKMCADGNLAVVNGIGFAHWAMPDPAERAKGLEEMKRDMALVAEMGGAFIAAPPFGLQRPGSPKVSLDHFADCYRAVLELGDRMGVTPILEFWGHSVNLSRLNEALYVVAASGHPKSAVLADVYHMYRGGSPYEGLRFLTPSTLPVLHMNDIPSAPPRGQLVDADRVWPGDGVAPWKRIFGLLREGRLDPWLSIELFNKSYWTTTPLDTLKTGLAKMKGVAENA